MSKTYRFVLIGSLTWLFVAPVVPIDTVNL
jgi:hypothetical protein